MWHFGWHVINERAALARMRASGVTVLPLYTSDEGGAVSISTDTFPGTGGVLGLTKSQLAEAKKNNLKPAGVAGLCLHPGTQTMRWSKCRVICRRNASTTCTCTAGQAAREAGYAYIFTHRILNLAVRHGEDFRRVLGRVIAHEVGHLVLPLDSHADSGISARELSSARTAPTTSRLSKASPSARCSWQILARRFVPCTDRPQQPCGDCRQHRNADEPSPHVFARASDLTLCDREVANTASA